MKRNVQTAARALITCLIVSIGTAAADDYDIDWHTIDGGGDMFSSGGDFELSGTIGQADAGRAAGGEFELSGGFWAGVSGVPILLGDLNCDGEVNFGDINAFVLALTDPAGYEQTYPGCPFENRDINCDGEFNFGDIQPFIALLTG